MPASPPRLEVLFGEPLSRRQQLLRSLLTSGPAVLWVKRGVTPDINALSTLIVLVSIAATIGVSLLQRHRQPKEPA